MTFNWQIKYKKMGKSPRFTTLNHDILNPITNLEVNRIWHFACTASQENTK